LDGIESILQKFKAQSLKGMIGLCNIAADRLARQIEREGLKPKRRDALFKELQQLLRDRFTLQLSLDLTELADRDALIAMLPPTTKVQ
jgi:hypothetical protein